jgi:hypothetical protein
VVSDCISEVHRRAEKPIAAVLEVAAAAVAERLPASIDDGHYQAVASAPMSAFSRIIHPLPSSRRAYSVFSSKPGSGRYFNSARPPKVVSTAADSNSGSKPPGKPHVASSAVKSTQTPAKDAAPSVTTNEGGSAAPAHGSSVASHALPRHFNLPRAPPHLAITAEDYKLHQFFSLHRPLLLLSQPVDTVFDAAPPSALSALGPTPAAATEKLEAASPTFDNPPEASSEADADAARQLARAIVMNRVGGSVGFEAALRKLGLDLSAGRQRVEDMDLSGLAVHLDSTKRKRRKKMKKHKCVATRYFTNTLLIIVSGCRLQKRRKVSPKMQSPACYY